jgi:hypothetical protein
LFWFGIGLLVLGVSFLVFPPYQEYCSGYQANDCYCAAHGVALALGALVDEHAGAVGAVATIFIGLFTYTLYTATKRLWLTTLRSGVKQSCDMRASLAHAERSLTAVERAYVFIDGFTPEITTAEDLGTPGNDLPQRYWHRKHLYMHRFAVLPRWKNGGNTPTRKMRIQVNWRGPEGPIPPEYVYRQEPQPFFLGPHAVEHSPPVEMPLAARIVDYGVHRVGVEPQCWIWGRADYEDIFSAAHFVEWCYMLRFDAHDGKKLRATLIQWGDYNRTDDG